MEVRLIHRRLLLEVKTAFRLVSGLADINAEIAPASRIVLRILPKGWRGLEHCGQEPGIIDGLHRTLSSVLPRQVSDQTLWENRALRSLERWSRGELALPRMLL
jgi:hypothetical protein